MLGLRTFKPGAASAASLAQKIAELEQRRHELASQVKQIEPRRLAALLDDDTNGLHQVETELQAATTEMERIDAVLPTLRQRHAEAEKTEQAGELAKRHAALKAEAAAVTNAIATDYRSAAAKILAVLEREAALLKDLRDFHDAEQRAVADGVLQQHLEEIKAPYIAATGTAAVGAGGVLGDRIQLASLQVHGGLAWPRNWLATERTPI